MGKKDFEFIGKAIFLPKQKILAVADLHIGFEDALSERGVFLPRAQYGIMKDEMKKIFARTEEIKEIIILGDLKHKFGDITSQEWTKVLDFLDFVAEKCEKITLIKGNHDKVLKPIADIKGLEVKDFYVSGENCFIHGNKIFKECLDKSVKRIILGHKHPAITIREGVKAEIYKCFLVGKWRGKEIIVLPSFFPLVEGTDVEIEDTNLALPLKFSEFEAYVPLPEEDKVLKLGKVKNIGKLN